MNYILFIGFSSEAKLNLGYSIWKGEFLERITKHSELSKHKIGNISYGIGYFSPSEMEDFNCYELSIDDINCTANSFKLKFSIVKKLDLLSSAAKSLIRNFISYDENESHYLPFCFVVSDDQFKTYSEDELLLQQIKNLTKKNRWSDICKLFEPLESLPEKPAFWNNPKLLSAISFATAKMSEVYINLKKELNSKSEIKNYLKEKKRYRKITLIIRERCIELSPDYPGYYSNLAFSYYQSCLELTTRGGRRDGSIRQNAEKAIEFIDKALNLEPNRITDLYRKGFILTNILPPITLFGNSKYPDKNLIFKVKSFIQQGIKAFQKVEEVYEIIPLIDEKRLIRFKKEYIKSLYDIARTYYQLIFNNWDYKQFLDQQQEKVYYDKELQNDIDKINISINYIQKCCIKDLPNVREIRTNPEIYAGADYDGCLEGVYKLYSMGKYFFTKYLLQAKTKDLSNIACDAIELAEKCFKRALSFPFPEEKKKISKGFIAEKLARIYIIKKNYVKAINILKNFSNKRTDYYIRYTLALAFFLNNNFNEAKVQIEETFKNPATNKDPLTGFYFLYHIELKLGNIEKANEFLQKAKIFSKCS